MVIFPPKRMLVLLLNLTLPANTIRTFCIIRGHHALFAEKDEPASLLGLLGPSCNNVSEDALPERVFEVTELILRHRISCEKPSHNHPIIVMATSSARKYRGYRLQTTSWKRAMNTIVFSYPTKRYSHHGSLTRMSYPNAFNPLWANR